MEARAGHLQHAMHDTFARYSVVKERVVSRTDASPMVELDGFEPTTAALQRQCSTN